MALIYGVHAVTARIQAKPDTIKKIWALNSNNKILELAKKNKIQLEFTDKSTLDNLTEAAIHQGVVAEVINDNPWQEHDIPDLLAKAQQPLVLILDGITDPHNLGACLRTADCAGVTLVVAPKDRACGLNATVSKVASGAAETVPFIPVTNLARTLKLLKDQGIWLYGTAEDAEQTVYQTTLTGPIAILMGSEGQGLRHLTREHCDGLMKIPMAGSVTSLNVSVATGVVLFEVIRQRH